MRASYPGLPTRAEMQTVSPAGVVPEAAGEPWNLGVEVERSSARPTA